MVRLHCSPLIWVPHAYLDCISKGRERTWIAEVRKYGKAPFLHKRELQQHQDSQALRLGARLPRQSRRHLPGGAQDRGQIDGAQKGIHIPQRLVQSHEPNHHSRYLRVAGKYAYSRKDDARVSHVANNH